MAIQYLTVYSTVLPVLYKNTVHFFFLLALRMLETVESGLINMWKHYYTLSADTCQIVQPNALVKAESKPLELIDFMGVILTFGIGVSVGIVVLLFEKLRQHHFFDRFHFPWSIADHRSIGQHHIDPVERLYPDELVAKKLGEELPRPR